MNSQLEEHNAEDSEIPRESLPFPNYNIPTNTTRDKISRLFEDMSPEQLRSIITLIRDIKSALQELKGKANMQIILSILAGSFFINPILTIASHVMGGKEARLLSELKNNIKSLRTHIPGNLLEEFSLENARGPGNSLTVSLFAPLLRTIRRCQNRGSMNEVLVAMNQLESTLLLRAESASNRSAPSSTSSVLGVAA